MRPDLPSLYQPDWSLASIKALCTTRTGGFSKDPYDSFNLGDHVGDDPQAVAANRRLLASMCGVRPVFLQQVHGTEVHALTPETPDGTVADACFSSSPGVACTIMVADCLPVLFTDPLGTVVGAAHAGWRGLALGVLEATTAAMRQRLKALGRPDSLWAWLGPCIGPTRFEVGAEVRTAFTGSQAEASTAFVPNPVNPDKYWADLAALARQRLRRLGIERVCGNDGSPLWCSALQQELFFSHRRDHVSGRFAALIWLENS